MEGEHSIAHAAAAVVRLCVHGDNLLACILRLIAFSEKTKITMLRTDVVASKHLSSRNIDLGTREIIVVNKLLEICLRLTV